MEGTNSDIQAAPAALQPAVAQAVAGALARATADAVAQYAEIECAVPDGYFERRARFRTAQSKAWLDEHPNAGGPAANDYARMCATCLGRLVPLLPLATPEHVRRRVGVAADAVWRLVSRARAAHGALTRALAWGPADVRQSDRVAQLTGCRPEAKIVPFRGGFFNHLDSRLRGNDGH